MATPDPSPLAEPAAVVTTFPRPLEALPSPAARAAQLSLGVPAPLTSSDEVRAAVRELLRHGGDAPTGRGKPASEYLVRAVTEDALASINAAASAPPGRRTSSTPAGSASTPRGSCASSTPTAPVRTR